MIKIVKYFSIRHLPKFKEKRIFLGITLNKNLVRRLTIVYGYKYSQFKRNFQKYVFRKKTIYDGKILSTAVACVTRNGSTQSVVDSLPEWFYTVVFYFSFFFNYYCFRYDGLRVISGGESSYKQRYRRDNRRKPTRVEKQFSPSRKRPRDMAKRKARGILCTSFLSILISWFSRRFFPSVSCRSNAC